mmetsp:Transcript_91412/g.254573  ORF Transcript_91412/g.254573 Transcript_91412/m.254573 type:complete len:212 (+) Transcript_91412:1377-2012(+)
MAALAQDVPDSEDHLQDGPHRRRILERRHCCIRSIDKSLDLCNGVVDVVLLHHKQRTHLCERDVRDGPQNGLCPAQGCDALPVDNDAEVWLGVLHGGHDHRVQHLRLLRRQGQGVLRESPLHELSVQAPGLDCYLHRLQELGGQPLVGGAAQRPRRCRNRTPEPTDQFQLHFRALEHAVAGRAPRVKTLPHAALRAGQRMPRGQQRGAGRR